MELVPGDLWVLAGAFAWAFHVLVIGWLAPRIDSFALAFGQTLVCALLSLAVALVGKTLDMSGIMAAIWPLLFCGIITTGVAFTIQVVAQKNTSPAHAALIMQLETVFAALSGWLLLGETMSLRGLMGAALILTGMLVSQFWHASRG
jgi:drug/metabolite transporter (DMT)-like permease